MTSSKCFVIGAVCDWYGQIQVTLDLERSAGELGSQESAAATATVTVDQSNAATAAIAIPSETSPPVAASQPYAASSFPSSSTSASSSTPGPGDRVMALYSDGSFYVAKIENVDEAEAQYAISYLEYGEHARVSFNAVKPYRSARVDELVGGNVPVKALLPMNSEGEGGLFYPGWVDGPDSSKAGNYWVRFIKAAPTKRKRHSIAIEDIIINEKMAKNMSATTTAATGATTDSSAPLTAELVPPPHLLPQEGDSEAVKASKARRLKKLRYEHKVAYMEQEQQRKKQSWQNFRAGKVSRPSPAASGEQASKKAKTTTSKAILQHIPKSSIFATPDTVGGVVGVIGSGRGMTEFDNTRKKHVFAQGEASATRQ